MASLFRKLAITFVSVFVLAAPSWTTVAKESQAQPSAPYCQTRGGKGCDVDLTTLPVEAQRVDQLIRQGGPFKYDKDGVVFGNREGMLPRERRGYYREYTVRTPSERSRGARRIVCGGRQMNAPEACYYTDDHYASFRRIVGSR